MLIQFAPILNRKIDSKILPRKFAKKNFLSFLDKNLVKILPRWSKKILPIKISARCFMLCKNYHDLVWHRKMYQVPFQWTVSLSLPSQTFHTWAIKCLLKLENLPSCSDPTCARRNYILKWFFFFSQFWPIDIFIVEKLEWYH